MISAVEWINKLKPYVPGAHYGNGYQDLASNEPPDTLPKSVSDAISASLKNLNRYPDPTASALRDRIASNHDVDPDCVMVGNGSDELIYLLGLAYLADNGRAVAAHPGYRMNEIVAQLVNATMIHVPLKAWRHDLAAMAEVEADVAFIVNPHNPTGTLLEPDALNAFIVERSASLVVVDEAYIDFAVDSGARTAIPHIGRGDVAVLRTFSKTYGLAGLRIGYLVSSPEIIRTLSSIRSPFSVGTIAQAAALAALQIRDHYEELARETAARRQVLIDIFRDTGFSVTESKANFILAFDLDETAVVDKLVQRRIVVRPGSALGVPDSIRMTVPAADAVSQISEALKYLE